MCILLILFSRSEAELLQFFEVLCNLLLGLSTYDTISGSGAKILYILRSLSTVKSCLVLVYLAENKYENAQSLLASLFDALVSSIRQEHSDGETGGHMGAVLQACIEEMSAATISQDILDTLLTPLLPGPKAENPAGKLCRKINTTYVDLDLIHKMYYLYYCSFCSVSVGSKKDSAFL